MRNFGKATRNDDKDKLDYEGFISPLVLHRFSEYMHSHRFQKDGTLRDSDNWQQGEGIPKKVYTKSLIRHTIDFWRLQRGGKVIDPDTGKEADAQDLLCAIIFNSCGFLFEDLKEV